MMRSFNAKWAALMAAAAVLLVGTELVPASGVRAQGATPQKSAQQFVRDGLQAQKARNHVAAVTLFSRAINMGGLARKQMAYALYYRAKSNRVRKQPAEAISDLNSALFFKGDLSSRDRANAIEERTKAFRDAGLKPTSIVTASPIAPKTAQSRTSWGASTRPAQAVAPPQRRVVTAAPRRVQEPIRIVKPRAAAAALPPGAPILPPASEAVTRETAKAPPITAFETRVAVRPTPARPAVRASSPAQSYLTPRVERGVGISKQPSRRQAAKAPASPWNVSTNARTLARSQPQPVAVRPRIAAAKPPAAPPASVSPSATPSPPAPTSTDASGGFGRFFANLLGNGQTTQSAGTTAVAPAATTVAAAPAPIAPSRSNAVLTQTAAAPEASPVAATVRPERARYFEIEVARLRNKDRADALAKQLVVHYSGGGFWGAAHKAHVRESARSGDVGAVYAVRYGQFASKAETVELCEQFTAAGYSCDVVAVN